MTKNVIQRLQKIENDLKTVICIYDVSNKCKNIHGKSEAQDDNAQQFPQTAIQKVLESTVSCNRVREPQTTQFDFPNNRASIIAQPFQDEYSNESMQSTKDWKFKKQKSEPTSFSTLSAVSYVKTKQTEDYRSSEKQDPVPDTDGSYNVNKVKCSLGILSTPTAIPKNVSRFQSSEEKNVISTRNHSKNSQDKMNMNENNYSTVNGWNETKFIQPKKIQSIVGRRNLKKKKESTSEQEKVLSVVPGTYSNQQKAQIAVEHENEELWNHELSKMIEKNNEKLKKIKVSKELALDIAKHLKEKHDEIQQSKQKLVEKLLKVQKDNERLKSELKGAHLKIEELEEYKTKQREEDVTIKETVAENIRVLKVRICELEKELLEKQQKIEKIQRIRLVEIRNELKNKENQARDLQWLSKEKCELLARNDEFAVLLKDRHLEKQFLEQKIRQLEEEVQTQKQHLKKKAKALEETSTELELIRQSSSDLEEQMKILKRNTENFDEIHKNLIKRTEEYEQQAKSNQEEMSKLKDENLTLKTELENQKDALLIKSKIIEHQQETIKQLKEKSEEAKILLKEKESLERILNTEREEKLELGEAVECLKWRKEELKKKIKVLENDLLLAPQKVARDLQKTQDVLFELENQIYSKQKEWELQLHSLIKEKEQACSIAEYATKKLIQTRSEFQKQSEADKKLSRSLTENFIK